MTTSIPGCMTVEHFDGATGRSLLFANVSLVDLAQILFSVLEVKLEIELEESVCISPVQTLVLS